MFEFLKDILGFPRPVKVIGYEEPEVVLQCDSPLDIGVVAVLADVEGVKIKAQVQVLESGAENCRCLWLAPAEVLPLLVEVFTPSEKRRMSRVKRCLRVRSTELDGFQGNSIDLSESGMRLEGKADLSPGDAITVSFELDDAKETKITTAARVCWIGPTEKDDIRALGIEFIEFNEDSQGEKFEAYHEFLDKLRVAMQA